MAILISRRQELLEAIIARLVDLENHQAPDGDDSPQYYPLKFSKVELGPLGPADHKRRYVAGVVPGREKKQTRFPITDCTLPVTVEFRMTVNQGDDEPGKEAEKVLTGIQRKISEDRTFGGLTLDVREIGNEVDLEYYDDKSIIGAVFFEALYRHSTDDPRTALPV